MNVLIDRHHAGLFRSLQLLGERLGWDVWTPLGMEWFDEGYWGFGRTHFGRELADQYLHPSLGIWAQPSPGRYVMHDDEFPTVPIQGVTLDTARRIGWDIVMATVQEDQEGFARFAREVGATYVYQVGNTGQQVDWTLDPLALVSAENAIEGRGVRYHQMMDQSFRWRDPRDADHLRISSFVNLMPRIQCWPWLQRAMEVGRGSTFRVYGTDCPDGTIKPASLIADLMARSGWGWHDKITGDGFGHVIHGWAAVGRPLVGHARHYAGKLAEPFWQDGETCIDLDRHEPDEAVEIIRTTSRERHAQMCAAIRAVYDRLVDTEAEVEAIRVVFQGADRSVLV